MAHGFTAVDLSRLPSPNVVETLDYEAIFSDMLEDLQKRDPVFKALLESDPAYKILEIAAYRELLLRQRVNEAARGVMLAYATGADLDNLGALLGVVRKTLLPGDPKAVPPVLPVLENDDDFRRRIQLAPEGFSTAGPAGAYVFYALTVDGVADASVRSPAPGEVEVTILSRSGNGTADTVLLQGVQDILSSDEIRPLTDKVAVRSATIHEYDINATLYFHPGPGREQALEQARKAIAAAIARPRRLGLDVTLSELYAALHQPGVQRVELTSPQQTITVSAGEAAWCQSITLKDGGVDA
ncbi:baseplate assembly protein [Haematospirillum jordaniae]|uniref:Baseplate assembly protein n=1 Tax=Haematospirillum jordaniae TaxID=1549855 RepID=A0A145VQJ8_9PROT|nr:baseplate J/gp47 family protein [Haematospirillum jordaniae]AMW35841.1 baseplate assembly protein [Haematospirillum jordaniae]NKD46044.1 baseplate assembly protein [Haematospirillum jordaniae]NKD58084.1 baseplate assembly protein [Haematospirillum jordaniae]NKD60192.1 baseplate assembly protein [Haematospirillum jordaniae]NKD68082.1 baseplate assembly protein [Haematospirillum jordaniae]